MQLYSGGITTVRFGEDVLADGQDLIAANDQRVGMFRAGLLRLELGQGVGDVAGRQILGLHGAAHGVFVDAGGHNIEIHPGISEQGLADRGPRREDDVHGHVENPADGSEWNV